MTTTTPASTAAPPTSAGFGTARAAADTASRKRMTQGEVNPGQLKGRGNRKLGRRQTRLSQVPMSIPMLGRAPGRAPCRSAAGGVLLASE